MWQPDYITVAEAKDALRIGDDADDAQLAMWISAASRAIDTHTNRQFGQLDVDRFDLRRQQLEFSFFMVTEAPA